VDILNEIYLIVEQSIELSLSYFINTEKRIHVLYLFSSLILAYYVYKRSKVRSTFIKYLFPKKIWLSNSAFVDYGFFFFNSLIKVLFIGPFLIIGLYIAYYTNELLLEIFGFPFNSISVTQTLILYTISLTIVNDLFTYIIHLSMHKIPFLWEFHKIHHSATSLNPLTQYRIHPVELIINNIRSIVVFGVVTGVFDYLSAHTIDKIIFLGVNVFHFIFLILGANLRHSHVKLKYPRFLEYIFISPFQHQIHHSDNPQHFNKNMGSKLAIWDLILGTLVFSDSVKRLRFGIGKEDTRYNNLYNSLLYPFRNIFTRLYKCFHIHKK
jgi:sterol desaturase/sphingolipid hydroxylase (fatty acid hydroxylase superfamily)